MLNPNAVNGCSNSTQTTATPTNTASIEAHDHNGLTSEQKIAGAAK